MKRGDLAYGALSIAMLAAAAWVIWAKYFREPLRFAALQDTTVTDMDGQALPFAELANGSDDVYFLFLELENCESCLYKGLNDIQALAEAGESAAAVVVNDWQQEVAGWSKHYAFPIYRLSKSDFYQSFRTDYLPMLTTFRHGEVDGARPITP